MLDLYILETCPYSRKVIDYFEDNDIKYNKKDITKAENLKKLIQLGGERQVPFLHDTDNDISMYESDDIIEYVKNKK